MVPLTAYVCLYNAAIYLLLLEALSSEVPRFDNMVYVPPVGFRW